MSELNVYHHELRHNEYAEFYLKYEADKVIAEKDKEIALLKDKANYNEYAYKLKSEELADACRFYEDELRHNKYKRCLAKADVEWLKRMILCNHPESISFRRAVRHEHKWEALAEKFKEAE